MRKLAIIHFPPIEWYPPVKNWLNYLAAEWPECKVAVYTLRSHKKECFIPASSSIRIVRPVTVSYGGALSRSVSYLRYYGGTLLGLIMRRPDTVLYYETISSLPALIYKKFFKRKARLFTHCHEYVTPGEYQQGMKLTRVLHEKEIAFYPEMEWLSQTNAKRLEFFSADNVGRQLPPLYILPNYPPASWQAGSRERKVTGQPVRAVYVGALSMDTMYVKEMAEWVVSLDGRLVWDIYSGNSTLEARQFTEKLGSPWIRFHEGVDYFSLPSILDKYDVGLILYKGHIPNYVYNIPNKLYEYLVPGLDVWFPRVMKGSLEMMTEKTYPKVTALDFTNLEKADLHSLISREGLTWQPYRYNCEQALQPLLEKIKDK